MITKPPADYMSLPDDLPRPEDDGAAKHLTGLRMPSLALTTTTGKQVDLSKLTGRTIVYAYPMSGAPNVELPKGWNDIPGARGCTPQTLSFQQQTDVFAAMGVTIFGLSTQTPEYQKELSDRLNLTFPILSDADFRLTDALRLPTMTVEGVRLIKRITLVINNGTIEHVFYPVFPPNKSAAEVLTWLQANPDPSSAADHGSGVTIYTTSHCGFCKAAKELLNHKKVEFTEVDVERDPEALKTMLARSGGRKTVPQIFIGSTHVGGSDDLQALDQSGKLDKLLAA